MARPAVTGSSGHGGTAGLLAWRVRVAQSLADRMGLAVDCSARHTSGAVPPTLITTPPHFYDDGVYDDPYASDVQSVGATLKQILVGWGVARGWVG